MNILFLARISAPFSGETIYKKPLGGSESALFYLAKELASLGHKITIVDNCDDDEGIFEGVEYKKFTSLSNLAKFSKEFSADIFVSFRDLPAFLYPIPAKKKVWWGHDDFSNMWNLKYPKKILGLGVLKYGGLLARKLIDKFFVPSQWLANILQQYLKIPAEKTSITRNGIYLPHFQENKNLVRDKHRLIYASVPDRGLDVLLDIFPAIKKEVPQAKLDVFCGFDLGMVKKKDRERAEKLYERTKQPGMKLVGTVKQEILAQEMQKSALLVYPSHELLVADFYAETSCISALQAQAAETPVVSSFRGALPESVKDGETGVLIKGDPYSEKYKEEFAQAVINLLKDEKKWQTMSKKAREHIFANYSWPKIAQEWETEFKTLLKSRG